MNTTGNGLIATAESMFDDEFQRAQFHRSMTIGMYATGMAAPVAAAILTLCLPREALPLSVLAIAPMLIGEIAGAAWLRRSVPRPRKPAINRMHMAVVGVGVALWVAAFVWRVADSASDLAATATGAAIGSAVGVVAAALLLPRFARWNHRRDAAAIDRRLGGDDGRG